MKKLIVGALLLALFGIPSVARAGVTGKAPAVVAEAPAERPTEPARVDDPPGEARDYAAREAAAPELGKFRGGGVAIYLGGSALTVVLVVVLIVILL